MVNPGAWAWAFPGSGTPVRKCYTMPPFYLVAGGVGLAGRDFVPM